MSVFVIANPKSRLGQTGAQLAELTRLISRHVGVHTLLTTKREGDGVQLAQEARARGATRIIVAGGDGTVSEVVTGLVEDEGKTEVELALLPLGTGRDFARFLKLGRELQPAVLRLARGNRRRIDAGRVRFRGEDGKEHTRCFLNIASLGLSGESACWLKQQAALGKRGRSSYIMSSLVGLSHYKAPRVTLCLDGSTIHDAPLSFAAAANGQYFAGGMRVAPHAQIDDGVFDVIVVPKLPMLAALSRFPLLIAGKHIDGHTIRMVRGRSLIATSDAKVFIEVDGEPVGTLPASIDVLPAAITLFGLP